MRTIGFSNNGSKDDWSNEPLIKNKSNESQSLIMTSSNGTLFPFFKSFVRVPESNDIRLLMRTEIDQVMV